jgi:cold shock CspA family protein
MEKELLDFCRVKKIYDKGFGFLSSINHQQDVFFHFSKIKDEKVREELEKLKRGTVYIYYTSQKKDDKRKVARMWLKLKNVPDYLVPDFKLKIIEELNEGKTNVFELTHVIKELKILEHIFKEDFELVLRSKKIKSNPSVLKHILKDDELSCFDDIDEYFNSIRDQKIESDIWIAEILDKIYSKI